MPELGHVLINRHQLNRCGNVCLTPNSGRAASTLKESAWCPSARHANVDKATIVMPNRIHTRTETWDIFIRPVSKPIQISGRECLFWGHRNL
jgi:hypothetical protein